MKNRIKSVISYHKTLARKNNIFIKLNSRNIKKDSDKKKKLHI